ncbi:CLUMA_CG004730, isoform A [Clunio marinus]|uniref:CLUMA_CG004730, isoform A n=1 Tax=Clunio marinus TaxID=568069 RepID=A0A1J1HU03_9DIPT|nr:CLUMA_CG004730, isoform A [Clunio marinus]
MQLQLNALILITLFTFIDKTKERQRQLVLSFQIFQATKNKNHKMNFTERFGFTTLLLNALRTTILVR